MPAVRSVVRTCEVVDAEGVRCDRPLNSRGMCHMHVKRWRRHGDPLADMRPQRQPCKTDGCDRDASSRGYCQRHYDQWRHARRCGEDEAGWVCLGCERCLTLGDFPPPKKGTARPPGKCKACRRVITQERMEQENAWRSEAMARTIHSPHLTPAEREREESRWLSGLALAWFGKRGVSMMRVAELVGLPLATVAGWADEGSAADRWEVERVTDLWRVGLEPVNRRLRGAALVAALGVMEEQAA